MESAAALDLEVPAPPTPAPEQPNSEKPLYKLLMLINAIDEESVELSLNDQLDLFENGKAKVDNYKAVIERLEAQAEIFKRRAEEYQTQYRVVDNHIKALKSHLIRALQDNGFSQFAGNEWVVKLQKARPSVVVGGEPSIDHKIRYPEFVRTKYEWDKKAIADALESGNDAAATLATLKTTVFAKFKLRKDI